MLFSIVALALTACGREAKPPVHVGPALGDTHVAMGPNDPTVPPPDAGLPPDPGRSITPPSGPMPASPAPTNQSNVPPAPPEQYPGVFAPPPASEGVPGTPVQEPTPVQETTGPRDTQ
jgi:hypothetical protein